MLACPLCDGVTEVIDSRNAPDNSIRRRRKCIKCGHRYSTYEIIEDKEDLKILKFYREKYPKDTRSPSIILNEIKMLQSEHDHFSLVCMLTFLKWKHKL